MDSRVAAIRADKKVGRNTCSFIDEATTDAELIELMDYDGIVTDAEAVLWAHDWHDLREDVANDIRNA